jgi:hypothetical protein
MRTCVNDNQGKDWLLTIHHSENGQHSLLVFKTPDCSHILRPFRLALDHGLQLLNQTMVQEVEPAPYPYPVVST